MSNKLSDIVDFNPSRILKKGTVAPFIEMAYLPTNTKFIKQIDEKPFSGGSKFKNGDTLFARITPCLENGKTGKVTNLKDEMIGHGSTEFIVMSAKEPEFDEDYIYYFARLPEFREFAQQRMVGTSGRQRVAWQDLADFEFIFPPKEQRKKAAALLNIYDQKIDLNTQINQTLEQIAQALFKSWFVDFDPVRAKVQALSDGLSLEQAELAAMQAISGKTAEELTALSQAQPDRYAELAETAKAFPCEMVEVDGVEVPKGWEVKRIEEVIKKIPVGKKYSSKTAFSEGLVPILDQGRSGVIGYHNDEPGVKASIEDPIIVFANHTCYMRLISYDFSAIQNVFAFKGKECDVFWVYLATLGKQEFVEYKGHFPDFLIKEIIVPPKKLTALFRKYVKESFSKIFINDRENSSLAKIRDLLLPKLLNGEI